MVTEPPVSESERREALRVVLESKTFARSVQQKALLRYICERELAGRLEDLTEHQIGVNVLGRNENFSLTEDSSVRNRAYELRQRLEKFYQAEQPDATVRIHIPRGSYIPYYTRCERAPAFEHELEVEVVTPAATEVAHRKLKPLLVAGIALVSLITGVFCGRFMGSRQPPEILQEAWGPLAEPGDDLLVSIATSLHMMVRPHIAPHKFRFPVPDEIYSVYGNTRPLAPGATLFMEPAQLSVPLAEAVAATTLCNMRAAFGGSYRILPESEAPIAAMRGRNAALIGSGTNSEAATILLQDLPFTIGYTQDNKFAVVDRRKPPGYRDVLTAQPAGDPVPSVEYGLLTVITSDNASGKPKRTLVISGTASAGVQSGVEFFCSPNHMREMKDRFRAQGLSGFPPSYQILVRCETVGLRLLSYEYLSHVVVQKAIE